MRCRWQAVFVNLGITLFITACGTIATPEWQPPTQTAAAIARANEQQVADTNTPLPTITPSTPSNTPVPPTDTLTPTQTATMQSPTEELAASDDNLGAGDPVQGEVLFNTVQPAVGFACATCHFADREDRLIGPGLLNVATRAETRVKGLSPYEYLYTSIVNPGAYVVPDYPDEVMPRNWSEIYSDQEINDIIAYLLTLH